VVNGQNWIFTHYYKENEDVAGYQNFRVSEIFRINFQLKKLDQLETVLNIIHGFLDVKVVDSEVENMMQWENQQDLDFQYPEPKKKVQTSRAFEDKVKSEEKLERKQIEDQSKPPTGSDIMPEGK
jgi:hypothetical protein